MKKLQECTTLLEAQPFLRGKSASFKKVVTCHQQTNPNEDVNIHYPANTIARKSISTTMLT